MKLLLPLLALAGMACADAAQTLADVDSISTGLSLLQADANRVVAGAAGISFALKVDAVQIKATLNNATANVNASPKFDARGSLQVGLRLLALGNTAQKSLDTISTKNTTFGELAPIVLYSLYDLKKVTNTFGTAVQAKLGALEKAIAPSVINNINAAFDRAIKAYGG